MILFGVFIWALAKGHTLVAFLLAFRWFVLGGGFELVWEAKDKCS